MAYRIRRKDKTVEDAVRRIACEQIDRALVSIDDDHHALAVHNVRKHCKKLRALVRVVRPAFSGYAQANADFRDTARLLSGARDAKVMQDTYDRLMGHSGGDVDRRALGSIRRRFTLQRKAETRDGAVRDDFDEVRARLLAARVRVSSWDVDAQGSEAVLGGLLKTYGRARRATREARRNPTGEAIHEMRKRIKYHWYHCRLLENVWPAMMVLRQDAAAELSDILGHHHDLDVFAGKLSQDPLDYGRPADVEMAKRLARAYQQRLEAKAWPIAERLLDQTPKAWGEHIAALWSVWREE